MKISFIGGGNMGCALISGLLKNGAKAANIHVVEPDPEKRSHIESEYKVRTFGDMSPESVYCDAILLAVKPQQLSVVASRLAPMLTDQLVISIAAGVLSNDLSKWLNSYGRIVRVMPNTPAQVSMGVSALYALPQVDSSGRAIAANILSSVGSTVWLEQEDKMDAFTALCGSGPAYVFYFLEAMIEAAIEMGFERNDAKTMVLDTFSGSIRLASESADEAKILREKVTSKGGTTERAILSMEIHGVKQHIVQAIFAARDRSREMGIELGKTAC
ncbi:MAG: pyrroline-5-carboxylate reductase [Burkholderiales bacterium]|nr:pyrroline-5-carboxylate reductase [Burkholderiales bacterium]